jgi:hypothetical protein
MDDGAGGLVNQTVKFPVWFEPVARGETPMSDALNQAYLLLQDWVSKHPNAYPPIAINITDGEATGGDPTPNAQAIRSLATTDGDVLLFNCHISSHSTVSIIFPSDESGLPDDYARMLFRMSSLLPDKLRQAAQSEGLNVGEQARGFAFNADLVELIRFLDIGTRPSNLR